MDTREPDCLEQAIREDGRYPPAAYEFLRRGLDYTTRMVYGNDPPEGPRHVSGQQLCHGLRALALELWGPLAPAVLRNWNIHTTRDFGEMVFLLVRLGVLGKQDSDRIEDFDNVYDFDEAFRHYEIPLERADGDLPGVPLEEFDEED